MRQECNLLSLSFAVLLCLAAGPSLRAAELDQNLPPEEAKCVALVNTANLTLVSAEVVAATNDAPRHCHVSGLIEPGIRWHMQLPLPANWNGRLVNIGNGGKAGALTFANDRVAQGYAVANSNTGHDNGSEPGASFGFNNREEEINFGYRAVHLTATASKVLAKTYYGKDSRYTYFEGCSTGGMQALMEAQRFPFDFDGIVGGAPVKDYQELNAAHIWLLQKEFRDHFAANLAFDTNKDGVPDSLTKLNMLKDAVLAKCDGKDGIADGVIDDPLACDFKPETDLAGKMCQGDVNADNCYTKANIQLIKDFYRGPYDSKGTQILKGYAAGSEPGWASSIIPHAGNNLMPGGLGTSGDQFNYIFYENDPGVPPKDLTDIYQTLDKKSIPPEWGWWEFNVDDITSGKGNLMISIMDAKDPDLTRFLNKKGGKLLLYHGWRDPSSHPEPTVDYYKAVVATTFKGDLNAARAKTRLFMIPGMDHCGGGPGPNEWDKLSALVEWVENGKAPDYLVAVHRSDARGGPASPVDNERKICAYPQRAVYSGPAGGEKDRANWVEKNFTCR